MHILRNLVRMAMLIGVACGASFASAQTFQETSLAFRKFDAKLQVGMTYARYVEALPDIVFAADEYERNVDAPNFDNATSFQFAATKYKNAARAWRAYLDALRDFDSPMTAKSFFWDKVMPVYCPHALPELENPVKPCIELNWKLAAEIVGRIQERKPPTPPLRAKRKPIH